MTWAPRALGAGFARLIGRRGGVLLLLAAAGCGTSSGTTQTAAPDPGTPTEGSEPDSVARERQRVLSLLEDVEGVDGAGLAQRYPVSFATAPTYRAESLQGLSLIQRSTLALNEA